ncbi:hypothetical protein [Chryseobacterium sp. Leaf201]|uniref:hypothetical protein n=1 Tax=Chryseobacterium sp. Leaf201 TaxID=1735672 RepID=UPI0006F9F377|nr:hypothetical protein [Chryseobacterium sp. Leaf201]KQM41781.1 hypothetical protein ASE55_13510 [Chryseobacterium sp. Leaf201]
MKHEGYNLTIGNPSYNYEYSGKERQKETGWSDVRHTKRRGYILWGSYKEYIGKDVFGFDKKAVKVCMAVAVKANA